MARNSENAPSEPSGRRRTPPEGSSQLRQQFRESIRDALTGVDVDELQGEARRRGLRVPASDVTLLTREALTDLEAELSALRAERAELERRAAERASGGVVVEEAPPVVEAEAPAVAVVEDDRPRRESRLPWRRARRAVVEMEVSADDPPPAEDADPSAVAWSPARAMEPVGEEGPAPRISAPVREAPAPVEAAAPQVPAPEAIPEPAAESAPQPEAIQESTFETAPPSKPLRPTRGSRRTQLTDAELESLVAPLLTELANLRAEVRELRADPESPAPMRVPSTNRQLVKLAVGLLLGFALIVAALAVVLKA